ncbi:MAG: hypothetical protein RLZ35_304 [Pseudomonadota bacterium]|jgi:coproporphyrinogen III oxidase
MALHQWIPSIKEAFLSLQAYLCQELALEEDQATFKADKWSRPNPEEGGGITNICSGGLTIEKAGVNFSHIAGQGLPETATRRHPHLIGARFEVLGISSVVHPKNPYAPTTHANVRFFCAQPAVKGAIPVWWFGGGFDLTPYYPFEEDCLAWHKAAYAVCKPFGESIYPSFKAWCDDYFYLPHRQEPRGIGGLFFDDLNEASHWPFDKAFDFVCQVGKTFIEAYRPILAKRKCMPYGEREALFQEIRRGRYVEFNLLQDRGTLFGLQSKGRTESILMSLPPRVRWAYDWQPEANSKEAELTEKFLVKRDWI